MRERLADNVATAGQEELNGLAFNQNVVVTLPGNTRFYIVVQKPASDHIATTPNTRTSGTSTAAFSGGLPTRLALLQCGGPQLRSPAGDSDEHADRQCYGPSILEQSRASKHHGAR
jgi:hypothetical protein